MAKSITVVLEQCKVLSLVWSSDAESSVGKISWQTGERMGSVHISLNSFDEIVQNGRILCRGDAVEIQSQDRSKIAAVSEMLVSILNHNEYLGVKEFSAAWKF